MHLPIPGHHGCYVGAFDESSAIAGAQRHTDALVLGVTNHRHPRITDGFGTFGRRILAAIVDDEDAIDVRGQAPQHQAYVFGFVVRRDDHGDLRIPPHPARFTLR